MAVRFLEKVNIVPGGRSCWEWTGSLSESGYGQFRYPGGKKAHRASYEIFVGPIPEGLVIDHLCRNTKCVKPDHLEAVTFAVNIQRAEVRWTACAKWHPNTPTRLITKPSTGQSICAECSSWRERRRLGRENELPPGELRLQRSRDRWKKDAS